VQSRYGWEEYRSRSRIKEVVNWLADLETATGLETLLSLSNSEVELIR
jgi:hypothetical protein